MSSPPRPSRRRVEQPSLLVTTTTIHLEHHSPAIRSENLQIKSRLDNGSHQEQWSLVHSSRKGRNLVELKSDNDNMTRHPRCMEIHEEDTEGFETIHIDQAALKNLFDIVKRLRRRKGCLGSQDDWYERVCPSNRCVTSPNLSCNSLTSLSSVKLSYNPEQAISDKAALGRAILTKDVLKSSVDALSNIKEQITRQLRTCEDNIQAYKRRMGGPPAYGPEAGSKTDQISGSRADAGSKTDQLWRILG